MKQYLLLMLFFMSIFVDAQENPCVSIGSKLDTITSYWRYKAEVVDLLSNEIIWEHPQIISSRVNQKLVVIMKDSVIHKHCAVIESFDTSGKKIDGGTLKNGKGVLREYNFNGSIENEFEFIDGNYNGIAKFYSKNGRLICMCYYFGNHNVWFEEIMGVKYRTETTPKCIGLEIIFGSEKRISYIKLYNKNGVETPTELSY